MNNINKTEKPPKISVIMAVYNAQKTLTESVDSIINQTYPNWEFIICDDCSNDSSIVILNKYKEKYPDKFILLRNDSNMKLPYSLNRCLEKASGEFVARMDADDISHKDRFQRQIDYLKCHPEVDMVGTAMQRFDENGLGTVDRKPDHPDKYSLRRIIPFNHATIMTYKYVYDDLGGYTVSDRTVRGQDYDLWFRFYYAGYKGDNLSDPLYYVREDKAAFKRRTAKVRWNGFKTTCIGYKLLGYPKRWLIRPALDFAVKSIIPASVFRLYHKNSGS